MEEKEWTIEFYTEDEIRKMIENKEELYYVDDGIDEAIVKVEDIPDFIVDYNRRLEMKNLKFYKVGKEEYVPDIVTAGEFLDRITPELRERLIDRLVLLQTGEVEPKNYKVIDEYVYSHVEEKMEQEKEQKKIKKQKNKEAR